MLRLPSFCLLLTLAALGLGACTGDLSSAASDTQPPSTTAPKKDTPGPAGGGDPAGMDPIPGPTPGTSPPKSPLQAAGPPRVWRLSNAQYARSVDALLGGGHEAAKGFLAEVGGHGFENSADRNAIADQRVFEYQRAAQRLAEDAVGDRARLGKLWPCELKTAAFADATCVTTFVTTFVGGAFRRPLLPEETASYQTLFAQVRDDIDGQAGVQLVIETALQSPSFLYRTEIGQLDAPLPGPGDVVKLTPYERASLLSYALWGTSPDLEFGASWAQDFASEQGLSDRVAQMLKDPRLLQGFETFIDGLVEIEALDYSSPATGFEPQWDRLRQSMRQESHHFLEHVLFSGEADATFGELMTADYNFVDENLAALYGVAAPKTKGEFAKTHTQGQRPGILGQAGVLAAHSLPDGTSPPRRGKLIAHRFACQPVPSPPDNVPIPEEISMAALTTREYFEAITGPGTCGAGCHVFLNPPGFALEHFDQVGRWREMEGERPVKSEVDLGSLGFGQVMGAAELGQQIAASPRALDCFTRELYRYVMGRLETQDETVMIAAISDVFRQADGDLRALMLELLTREPLYQRQFP